LKRIGVFGGTFNPIHVAHLIAAESVREQLGLNKVLFIPSAKPPHKGDEELVDGKLRLEMVRIAVKGNKYFEASDIEVRNPQGSKSYTVETLRILSEMHRDSRFFLIMGADQFNELDTWKEPDRLFEYAEVIVMNRAGCRTVKNEYWGRVKHINIPNLEISSTEIRRRLRDGKTIRYLVKEEVEKFIRRKRLYL